MEGIQTLVYIGRASVSNKSFALSKDFKPAAVKLDNIERLEGQHNYEDWASQMAISYYCLQTLLQF